MPSVEYKFQVDRDFADRLEKASKTAKIPVEELIIECLGQHLDFATRHRLLFERIEIVDQALVELAEFIGEATAESGQVDLSHLCKYASVKP
ncbi:hypothetical protein SAMN05444123_101223 [Rhodopseudomonas pseudopalustris]|uniref:Uncharacterized protein n=1 Tax=Rhodopseudomonas pseudopalustris TaxID=1513892 RepID=A0A1H8LTY5_9BRAD|nr:hypothetical protein SAMN05444123_101223 [Rhodopseudomonas pseudopalustris]